MTGGRSRSEPAGAPHGAAEGGKMPKDDGPRPREFLFEPLRFLNDENVRTMRPHELGAYTALWCAGWDQPEPGVLPDDDRLLGFLARCTPDEWAQVREAVARCYDRTSRPGAWIQQGTVETARRQAEKLERARADGRRGGSKRWGSNDPEQPALDLGPAGGHPTGGASGAPTGRPNGEPVAVGRGRVGVGVGEGENPQPKPDARPEPAERFPREWPRLFEAFWNAWPVGYKVGRNEAERSWARITPKSQATLDAILEGLERWKRSERWARSGPNGEPAGYLIPNPKTWLNQGRWRDDIAAAGAGGAGGGSFLERAMREQGGA